MRDFLLGPRESGQQLGCQTGVGQALSCVVRSAGPRMTVQTATRKGTRPSPTIPPLGVHPTAGLAPCGWALLKVHRDSRFCAPGTSTQRSH